MTDPNEGLRRLAEALDRTPEGNTQPTPEDRTAYEADLAEALTRQARLTTTKENAR